MPIKNRTLYTLPYLVFGEQEYTKHYYIEGERVSSKLGGGFANYGLTNPENDRVKELQSDYNSIASGLLNMLQRDFECAGMEPEQVTLDQNMAVINQSTHHDNPEHEQYFYHTDHLGSSSFISDLSGTITQHLQYLPFGETFIEQQNTSNYYTPYKFSAKEKDEETGYSYFGARYYSPEISVWLSVDPMSDKYPYISPYNYCRNNPIMIVDPNGMEFDDPKDLARAKESQNQARTKIAEYNNVISDLKNQKTLTDAQSTKLNECEAMVKTLENHISNIDDMINTKEWKYAYNKVDDPNADLFTYYKKGVVIMDYADGEADKQAHEETHGHQYFTGEIMLKNRKTNDLNDEAMAYQIEFSFRTKERQDHFIKVLGVKDIKGVQDITAENLAKSPLIQKYYPSLVKKIKTK